MIEHLTSLIRSKKIKEICQLFFNYEPTEKQQEIIKSIAYHESKRIVISAFTRYGKTFSVAIGVLLYILFNENKKILIIAPIYDQASILRNYIAENILRCPILTELLEIDIAGVERIKKEVSKKRLTFKNGCELMILSAEGEATRLLGWGGDMLLLDESCLIDFEVYRQKISRMLGDNPNAVLVEIGNPWNKNNQFYEHWIDPNFKKIHIDYKTGLKEGRITKEYIEEQKKLLTPIEFKVLYEAEFPEESEDQLIKYEWIKKAINKDLTKETEGGEKIAGLDVAEKGIDLTVLTIGLTKNNHYKIENIVYWSKLDTMQTVGKTIQHIGKNHRINVDATGIGAGVEARLREMGYTTKRIIGGESPDRERERFLNKKAQNYWRLRTLFEEGRIQIPNHKDLISQLTKMRYELTSAGKIKIIDPEDKSPDFSDSLAYAVSYYRPKLVFSKVRMT